MSIKDENNSWNEGITEEKTQKYDVEQKGEKENVESRPYNLDNDENYIVSTSNYQEKNSTTEQIDKNEVDVPSSKEHKPHGCISETYDVINGAEVQDIKGWESIHKESLSEIPPIDHGALNDLESRAKDVAGNLDHLLGTLAASLKSMSVVSVQSVDAYKTSIQNVEDTVDVSVKNMYSLIAKCEELNDNMKPLYNMAAQIKDIKRTLDVLESVCK